MSRARYNRTNPSGGSTVPVLPQVIATADRHGRLSVQIDGAPFTQAPIGRTAFGVLLDQIIACHGTPLLVEVRENDGTTYTNILTAPASSNPAPPADKEHTSGHPKLLVVSGDGFIPGEDVATAPITLHTSAGPDGHARALVETASLGTTREVILFGRISGTAVIIGVER